MSVSTKPCAELIPNISADGKIIAFTENKQTLLECLEQADVEVHYHCRDGFCGACRVTLNGEVSYPNGEPLAYVGENEILPCCCIPITDITLTLE
ncbi:class I ribonucleotide reductase maintenance protein YfaE [Colwellia sp. MSW7]|uniref:Class I ribonucleotide reductase maintenance protein YfaE n=1 Tax=Colwellia maritima TaxID=2912588 RepID=A0ABS9X2E8_9GAMM|nr:class I ribonucleotide reductase maintenance protein YfaE [Colwellia maritima]MCI2284404.1 class I ribonucleotide reductase maintenance protein YfaE [Colwellia maritima]